jgi:hypothetical protein
MFQADVMRQEVNSLSAEWMLHYQKRDYEGDWSALPLRSINGSLTNLFADNNTNQQFADTPLMSLCPTIKNAVDTLQCPKIAVRLLNLKPGSVIKEHTDKDFNFEQGEARIHIPIATNDEVGFYLDDERMVLKEGECWYMNFNLKHRIANNGTTDRIHLVVDCIVNDWMMDIFNDGGAVKSTVQEEDKFSRADKRAMIENFRAMNTPVSLQMAEEMERGLKK